MTFAQASPIRIVVVSDSNAVSSFSKIQVTEAAAFRPQAIPHGPMIAMPIAQGQGRGHHLCQKFKNKALEISNKFRETFGLPLIEKHPENFIMPPPLPLMPLPPPFSMKPNELKILPMDAYPRPLRTTFMAEGPHGPLDTMEIRPGHEMMHNRSFVHRLHRALVVLGPWEGRAVAFVLGE